MNGDRELVVFCGFRDWANSCGAWAQAIRAHSELFDARCVMRDQHPFGYDQDIVLGEPLGGTGAAKGWKSKDDIRELIDSATWYIHGGDSDYRSWKFYERLVGHSIRRSNKRLGVWHCGTGYRRRPRRFNFIDRHILGLERRFIAYDLIRLTSKDPRAMAAPHNAFGPDDFKRVKKADVLTISHSPSKPGKKGTHLFEEAVAELKGRGHEFEVDLIHGVSIDECLERKARSHIFFDQINVEGGIGTSTAEAAAAGACVVSAYHNIPLSVQEQTGGAWPIVHADDRDSLVAALESLIVDDELRERTARETYDWFLRLFSRESVAAYFDRALAPERVAAGTTAP